MNTQSEESPDPSDRSGRAVESTSSSGQSDSVTDIGGYDIKEKIEGLPENVRSFLKENGVEILAFLAKGSFANVYKAKVGDQILAVKAVALDYEDKERERFEVGNEIRIAKTIKHKNIIKSHMVLEMEKSFVFLVQDFADGGDLITIIEKDEPLGEKWIKKWFSEVVAGINFLHSNGIAHRDIKADNVLLQRDAPNSDQWSAKVTDFGFSHLCFDEQKRLVFVSNYVGTVEYSSPENLIWKVEESKPFDPFLSDSYSLGVLLYLMITHKFPFKSKRRPKTKTEVKRYHKRLMQRKWKRLKILKADESLYDLLEQLLESDVRRRIKTSDIISHSWLSSDSRQQNQ